MAISRSRSLRILTGLAISGLFLFLAGWSLSSRGVGLDEVIDRLAQGDLGWIAVYIGVLLALQFVRIARWGILVRGIGPVSTRRIFGVALLGQAAIGLLPVRLGEAVRPVLIADKKHINVAEGAATVVVERIIDGLLIGIVFIGVLFYLRNIEVPREFSIGAHATAAAFGGMAIFLILAGLFRKLANRIITTIFTPIAPNIGEKLSSAIESFLDAVITLAKHPRRGLSYLALTLVVWGINAISFILAARAFGVHITVFESVAILCVVIVGFMIPAGPAGTGTFNYAIILAFQTFGVDDSTTGALSILIYLVVILISVITGVAGLLVGGISLGQTAKALEEDDASTLPSGS